MSAKLLVVLLVLKVGNSNSTNNLTFCWYILCVFYSACGRVRRDRREDGSTGRICAHERFLAKHAQSAPAQKATTLSDRLKQFVANRRATNKRIIAESGIIEEYRELKQSRDVVITEVDRKKELEAELENRRGLQKTCATRS